MFRTWKFELRTERRDKGGSIDGSPLDLPPKHSISSVAPPPRVLPHKAIARCMVESQLSPKPSGLRWLRV